jgi:pathogenesis-related protein 1
MKRIYSAVLLLQVAMLLQPVDYVSLTQAQCTDFFLLTGNTSPSPGQLDVRTINAILTEHNRARRNVFPWASDMPMLQWSPKLAGFAQEYQDTCPHGQTLTHSSGFLRTNATRFGFTYVGENLAAGPGDNYLPTLGGGALAAQSWTQDAADYTYGAFNGESTCVTGKVCSHYTQIIWAGTTHVGCGYKRCENLPLKNYWGCVYGQAGNTPGQYPYNSTGNTSEASACQNTSTTQRATSGISGVNPASPTSTTSGCVGLVCRNGEPQQDGDTPLGQGLWHNGAANLGLQVTLLFTTILALKLIV